MSKVPGPFAEQSHDSLRSIRNRPGNFSEDASGEPRHPRGVGRHRSASTSSELQFLEVRVPRENFEWSILRKVGSAKQGNTVPTGSGPEKHEDLDGTIGVNQNKKDAAILGKDHPSLDGGEILIEPFCLLHLHQI